MSDDDGLARFTVQNKDIVGALDFLDVNPPACNQVEMVPVVEYDAASTETYW